MSGILLTNKTTSNGLVLVPGANYDMHNVHASDPGSTIWFKKTKDGFYMANETMVHGKVTFLGDALPQWIMDEWFPLRQAMPILSEQVAESQVCKSCKGTKQVELMRSIVTCLDCA